MNWVALGIAMLSGAIASLVTYLILPNRMKSKTTSTIVFLVLFSIIQGFANVYIYPDVNSWNQARIADSELQKISAYKEIKKYYPETYKQILLTIKHSIKSGLNASQTISIVRPKLMAFIFSKLPISSDRAASNYVRIMVTEATILKNKYGSDLCYSFFIPNSIHWTKYFSKEIQNSDMNALGEVIKASSEDPQPIPQAEDALNMMKPVRAEMAQEYGSDVSMFQNIGGANVDRGKLCAMTISLYSDILKLPSQTSGKIIRYMMSTK